MSTEIIGSDAIKTVPVNQYYSSMVNFKPGDGETVDLNPPRFCWSYLLSMLNFYSYDDTSANSFRFQISPNSNMSSPVVNVVCNYNWYNSLSPLTAGNTYYWQIEYRTPVDVTASDDYIHFLHHGMVLNQQVTVSADVLPGNLSADTTYYVRDILTSYFKLAATSGGAAINISSDGTGVKIHRLGAIRSFTIAADAVEWDRHWYADSTWLSTNAAHPHMMFNAANRAAVAAAVTAHADWAAIASSATSTIAQTWWPNDLDASPGARASLFINVALAWQMTQSATWSNADPELALVNLAEWYMESGQGRPGIDIITNSDCGEVLTALSLGYDWLYDLMDGTQKATVLDALQHKAEFVLKGSLALASAAYDETGAYSGTGVIPYSSMFKAGHSHGWYNFAPNFMAGLSAFGEDADCLELMQMGISYMVGVTFPFGDGCPNQGSAYGTDMVHAQGLYAQMLADSSFPDLGLTKIQWWQDCANYYDRLLPAKYVQAREHWGDGGAQGSIWGWSRFGRDLALFTQNGRVREHWDIQKAVSGTGSVYNSKNIALQALYSLPAASTTYATRSTLFDRDGWVIANSVRPNSATAYTAGTGFSFEARPRGSEGGHSSYSDGGFHLYAYGATLTGWENGLDAYTHVAWAGYTICYNGLGQHQPAWGPVDPYYGYIMAHKETADYVYCAADLTEAYPDTVYTAANVPDANGTLHSNAPFTNLTKVHRHILFMHDKYWVIFDDMASSVAGTWSWVYHVLPDTVTVDTDPTTFHYTTPDLDAANVSVYVQHIGNAANLTLTHYTGSDVAKNPITAEDYWANMVATNGRNNTLWVSSASTQTAFTFCTVIFPVAPGGSAPTITRVDDKTVTVVHAASGINETISFDTTNTTANFVVNLDAESDDGITTLTVATLNVGTLNVGA